MDLYFTQEKIKNFLFEFLDRKFLIKTGLVPIKRYYLLPTIPMYLERQKIQIDKLSTGSNDSSFICTTFNQFTNTRTISPTGSTSSWANVRDRSASADSSLQIRTLSNSFQVLLKN